MENQVILNKDANTAKLIREYFESKAVDTSECKIELYGCYYGVINRLFGFHFKSDVEKHKAEIIELQIKKEYPKVMLVWNHENFKKKRVVFTEKKGKFISWCFAETLEESENETGTTTWIFAQDIEEPKQITIQEAEKIINDLGNNVKIV